MMTALRNKIALLPVCGLLGALPCSHAAVAAPTVFYTTTYVACSETRCPPNSLAWSSGAFDQIYLVNSQGPSSIPLPITLASDGLAKVLETLQVTVDGKPNPLFSHPAAESFAHGLAVSFAKAKDGQEALFMIVSSVNTGGLFDRQLGHSGRAWLDPKGLHLQFTEVQVDFIGPYEAVRKVHEFNFGDRERNSGIILGPDAAEHPRPDVAVIALATQVDTTTGEDLIVPVLGAEKARNAAIRRQVASPYPMIETPNGTGGGANPATAGASAPAVAAPAPAPVLAPIDGDAAERRLATLQRLRQKGLISEQEFQDKRKSILDGL